VKTPPAPPDRARPARKALRDTFSESYLQQLPSAQPPHGQQAQPAHAPVAESLLAFGAATADADTIAASNANILNMEFSFRTRD